MLQSENLLVKVDGTELEGFTFAVKVKFIDLTAPATPEEECLC